MLLLSGKASFISKHASIQEKTEAGDEAKKSLRSFVAGTAPLICPIPCALDAHLVLRRAKTQISLITFPVIPTRKCDGFTSSVVFETCLFLFHLRRKLDK